MSYTKQTWTNDVSELNATRLGVIEQGIEDAHTLSKHTQRYLGRMQAQGWYEETFNRQASFTTSQPTSGDVVAGLIYLLAGDVVTNFIYELGVNAASVTTCKFGLYDTSGNLLASSANDTTAITGSNGPRKKAASSPYT